MRCSVGITPPTLLIGTILVIQFVVVAGVCASNQGIDDSKNREIASSSTPSIVGNRIVSAKQRRIPVACGRSEEHEADSSRALSKGNPPTNPPPTNTFTSIVPAGARMWETVPGVIRNNGTDAFRLEVNVNGPVSNVVMQILSSIASASGQAMITLRDNGQQGDRATNDFVFTSELLRYDTNQPSPLGLHLWDDTNSPTGIGTIDLGTVTITETNGTQRGFLVQPQTGIVDVTVPLVEVVTLSTNVALSPHLINVRGTNLSAQKFVRNYSTDLSLVSKSIYQVLPDAFDFLIQFSTYRVEWVPETTGRNFNIGVESTVQVNFTGTGLGMHNSSAIYGSAGRLKSLIALDSYDRGIQSQNCAHEILHLWGAYLSAFPFVDGVHYNSRSSVGSLLGGQQWIDNGDGTRRLNCDEGRNGATHASPLDKYLMGLIYANEVPALRVYPTTYPQPLFMCNGTISNVASSVTASDVVAAYGIRSPNPTTSQKSFSLGFVAESNQRLLNQVEMTFYDILAGHFTKPLPDDHADPYLGQNWAPITRFFGDGVTWSSEILSIIRPTITSIKSLPNGGAHVTGTGYPDRNYQLLRSTNGFSSWLAITNRAAATNGSFVLVDSTMSISTPRYYRVATQ